MMNTVVSFDGAGLRLDTEEDAEVICNELIGKEVEVLILKGNTFNLQAAERVGTELSMQSSLQEAHFKDLFTSRGREIVPDALKHLLGGIVDSGAELTLLDLSDNAIGPVGAPPVVEFLNSPSARKLEKLYIQNCGLGPEGCRLIAPALANLIHLREFSCGRNRWENKGSAHMAQALSQLSTLEALKLNQNGISVAGIKEIVKILEANIDNLRFIDLSDNTIKEEGAEALWVPIRKAEKLEVVLFDDALLENEGFSMICDALAKSASIEGLKLASFSGNEISGMNVIDLVMLTFEPCSKEFALNLMENDFELDELEILESLSERFKIFIDDIEEDVDYEDEDYEYDDDNDTSTNGEKLKEFESLMMKLGI